MRHLVAGLPPSWTESRRGRARRVYSLLGDGAGRKLFADGSRVRHVTDEASLSDAFEHNAQMFVAEHAPHRIFIHAGVVGLGGQAVLIPGLSFSGKSTLTAALVRAGATYYSDEYAVLDVKGRVWPYARRLSIRQPGEFKGARHAAEEWGARIGKSPLPVRLILMTKYVSGARWNPVPRSAGQGVLALLSNAVAGRTYPERVMPVLAAACANAMIIQSRRGEVEPLVPEIISILSNT